MANRFWLGINTNYSDISNWALTSGGTGGLFKHQQYWGDRARA